MNRMFNLCISKKEIILFSLFSATVLVDIVNGFIFYTTESESVVGVVYRAMVIVILSFIYFLKKGRVKIDIFVGLSLFFCSVSLVSSLVFNSSPLLFEISNMSKLMLFLLLIQYFHYKHLEVGELYRHILYMSLLVAVFIIGSFIFKTGVGTYGGLSFGTKSFFRMQNDIGIMLVVSLNVSIYRFLIKKNSILPVLILLIASMVLATRTSSLITIALLFAYSFVVIFIGLKDIRRNSIRIKSIAVLILAVGIIGSYWLFKIVSENKYLIEKLFLLLSGDVRGKLPQIGMRVINSFNLGEFAFGKGSFNFLTAVAATSEYGLYFEYKFVEQDTIDILGSYGVVVFLFIFSYFLICVARSIFHFLIEKTLLNLSIVFSLGILFIHSILAGHVLQSPSIAPIFASALFAVSRRKAL